MKPVVDKDGNVIGGLFRSDMGHLVIDDKAAHAKYIKTKQTVEDVDNLKKQLSELTEKVSMLMSRLETNDVK